MSVRIGAIQARPTFIDQFLKTNSRISLSLNSSNVYLKITVNGLNTNYWMFVYMFNVWMNERSIFLLIIKSLFCIFLYFIFYFLTFT
jgi:hypothetical protein